MRLARLVAAGLVAGVVAGFAAALLRPRRSHPQLQPVVVPGRRSASPELDLRGVEDDVPVAPASRASTPAGSASEGPAAVDLNASAETSRAIASPPTRPVPPSGDADSGSGDGGGIAPRMSLTAVAAVPDFGIATLSRTNAPAFGATPASGARRPAARAFRPGAPAASIFPFASSAFRRSMPVLDPVVTIPVVRPTPAPGPPAGRSGPVVLDLRSHGSVTG